MRYFKLGRRILNPERESEMQDTMRSRKLWARQNLAWDVRLVDGQGTGYGGNLGRPPSLRGQGLSRESIGTSAVPRGHPSSIFQRRFNFERSNFKPWYAINTRMIVCWRSPCSGSWLPLEPTWYGRRTPCHMESWTSKTLDNKENSP